MASWQQVPSIPGNNQDGGIRGNIAGAAGGADLNGLLDASGNVNVEAFNGLDMDMSLPMDLDMDLSQQTQAFNPMGQPQQTTATGSLAQEQSMVTAGEGMYIAQSRQPQDMDMTAPGAGPLPTSFGMPAPQNSSTLTEFTKRRNWSQRIIEELKDFLHILTPDGRILWVSPSCKAITGYDNHMVIGKFIAEFVHPDDSGIFMREFNESIASGNSLRFFYRFKKEDGTFMIFECDGHPHISNEPGMISGQAQDQPPMTGVCRGFFMMARPYPTKNAALLDSFLEHKIENERLLKRIEELKREEAEENAEQDRLVREQPGSSLPGATPVAQSQAASTTKGGTMSAGAGETTMEENDYQGMPPPAKPPISNTALTRQNLDSALSSQKPDSIADKMSRYEANSTHLESIELLTGLRYRDGERSHGISTGDTSPALIRGDAGIAILLDRDRDGPKKDKKKQKLADEYVCADCGTLDSPEWRKGPKGPKTLCNACGLRWAKKEKKRSGDDGKMSNNSPMSGPTGSSTGLAPGATAMGGIPQPPGLPMQTSTGSSG
jgi:PAS domain S-box-containing protein